MSTGPQAYSTLTAAIAPLPAGSVYWIDLAQKYDLCKLTEASLTNLRVEPQVAKSVAEALDRGDVGPLGKSLGIELGVKFRLVATRRNGQCELRCPDKANVDWLASFLRKRFPDLQFDAEEGPARTQQHQLHFAFTSTATPFAVRKALLECEAATLVQIFPVRVFESPHFRVAAHNFASWLDDQDKEPWWTVDGDPLLMSRVEFPAPADELATAIRSVGKPLQISDPAEIASGEEILGHEIDRAVTVDELGNRTMLLSWPDSSTDWQLFEDEPTSERPF